MKVKKLIRKWLGITDYEFSMMNSQNTVSELRRELGELKGLLNIGIDHHISKFGGSWAVVCIQGKPEYINFINLDKKDAMEIKHIFRNFIRESNFTIDTPFLREMFSGGRY